MIFKVFRCSQGPLLYPEGLKYSPFLVAKESRQVVVGFDNHKPKGTHLHHEGKVLRQKRGFYFMMLKKVRIIVQSVEDTKAEWARALRGEILNEHPESIYALAKMVGRDFKNVYSDVKMMAEVGLLELKSTGKRDAVKPIAKHSGLNWI